MSTETILPEWVSAFRTLILVMTKEESADYCRGCHMGTYPGDSFHDTFKATGDRFAEMRQELAERLSLELGPNEQGWDYQISGATRDGEVREVASGSYDKLAKRWWPYGHDDAVTAWLNALHEEAATAQRKRRNGRLAEERKKRAAEERKEAFRDLRSAIRTLGRDAVLEYVNGTDSC
jgi:uncharacterized protein with von Willebrand factor type A (vWA) domain